MIYPLIRSITSLFILHRFFIHIIISLGYLLAHLVIANLHMCIPQIPANHYISVQTNIAGICLIPFYIIFIFKSRTMIFCTYNWLPFWAIIILRNTLPKFIILVLNNCIPCITSHNRISLGVKITVFHPVSIIICPFIRSIPISFPRYRILFSVIIECSYLPSRIIKVNMRLCIAQIPPDHQKTIQPYVPDICIISLLIIFIFKSCAIVFCTNDRILLCIIIQFWYLLSEFIILIFKNGIPIVISHDRISMYIKITVFHPVSTIICPFIRSIAIFFSHSRISANIKIGRRHLVFQIVILYMYLCIA